MALSISQTVALAPLLKDGMRIASMGYPDLIAPVADVHGVAYREDSDAICKRHGLKPRKIPDAHSYFSLLGCKLDVYDVVRERGCEIILDLNRTVWTSLNATDYDIVLDVGTLEHCFNIAQAIVNMAGMVKQGGYIIHENPFNCGNHGFYNLNPTFYSDFYEANGFEVIDLCLANRHGERAEVPAWQRFRFSDAEANTFCVARRKEMCRFIWPVQSKYQGIIQGSPAAGVSGEIKEMANG